MSSRDGKRALEEGVALGEIDADDGTPDNVLRIHAVAALHHLVHGRPAKAKEWMPWVAVAQLGDGYSASYPWQGGDTFHGQSLTPAEAVAELLADVIGGTTKAIALRRIRAASAVILAAGWL